MTKTRRPSLFSELPEQGLEELNLVEFPLGLLVERIPDSSKTLEFSDTIKDQSTGRELQRKVTVAGSEKWGLPNWQDIDVLLALMKLTNDKQGFRERTVSFSLYELREVLGWPDNGWASKRLARSLKTLVGITVVYENAWRKNGKWTSLNAFHLLDNVKLTNTLADFDPDEDQHLKWNDVIVESVQASNTKGINWEFYRSLRLPTSKRLYRFLDKRFAASPQMGLRADAVLPREAWHESSIPCSRIQKSTSSSNSRTS